MVEIAISTLNNMHNVSFFHFIIGVLQQQYKLQIYRNQPFFSLNAKLSMLLNCHGGWNRLTEYKLIYCKGILTVGFKVVDLSDLGVKITFRNSTKNVTHCLFN